MDKIVDLTTLMSKFDKDGTKKMNIKGEIKNMDVYKIPLEYLYYNDQNDRIATWINKYESQHSKIYELDKENYNSQIQKYLIDSNRSKFEQTKNNIKNFTQLEPGVVFADGRIIDGNRRFSCLVELFKDTTSQSFNYFRAVILSKEINDKEIKLMELTLQHGREEKLDYNPIEKLVGIYRDTVKNRLVDLKEYAASIDFSEREIKKEQEIAILMADFLEYINAPEQFYIARELEIDGPLLEIYNIKKRLGTDEDKWEKTKITLYDNMLMKTNSEDSGDITRIIRDFGKKVVSNDMLFENYYSKHDNFSREIHNKLQNVEIVDTEYIRKEIRENDTLKTKMRENLENILYEAKKDIARKQPIDSLNMAIEDIEKIDLAAISCLKNNDKNEFEEGLKIIKEKIDKIENKIHEII